MKRRDKAALSGRLGLHPLAWHGFFASTLITFGSWGVGWFPRNQLSALARSGFFVQFRTDLFGVLICIAAMAVGIVWLMRTWLMARPWVGGSADLDAKQQGKLIAMWAAPLMLSFPILSRDVYSYLAQGRMLEAGLSPYTTGISVLPGWFDGGADGLWAQSPSPYGPFFLVLSRWIYVVSGGVPEIGIGLLRIVAVIGVIGCYFFTVKLAAKLKHNTHWAVWAVVGNPLFLLTMVGGVHNDALMIAGVFWAFLLAFEKKTIMATLALSLAVSIKPIVLVLLPFIGLVLIGVDGTMRQRILIWVKTSCFSALWLLIIGAVTNLWFGWLPAMFTAGDAAFPYAPVGLLGWSLGNLAQLLGGSFALTQQIVVLAFQLLAMVLVAKFALAKDISNPIRLSAWALSAVVLLSPLIQPWYVLWLIALFAISKQLSAGSERLMIWATSVILVAVFVDQLSIEQWYTVWLLKLAAGALMVGLMLVMYRFDERVRRVLHLGSESSQSSP
ncbi:polyprenol phosphomannose-dependent alpha 1,6 mannosyltransferase MptB [Glutamicibacter sp.]|uniref:polyprenol phosphomannose-dependent alpha 1,6 mannosyltransferase MptB n=1 Tax=Glutamicibacter sp. TaxID=1931995 RepID=UPI0028BDF774|nr:polyprenol phosphomannose-dependent alpha 1,6 mannosyltransferase MptB [Glutamicibacter sp.]